MQFISQKKRSIALSKSLNDYLKGIFKVKATKDPKGYTPLRFTYNIITKFIAGLNKVIWDYSLCSFLQTILNEQSNSFKGFDNRGL